jgi:hypothetical protein
VLVRKSCVAPTNSNNQGKHGKRCTRFIPVGHFKHTDNAGKNSFTFDGVVNRHLLAPHRYRLDAVATNANGTSRVIQALFRIVQ